MTRILAVPNVDLETCRSCRRYRHLTRPIKAGLPEGSYYHNLRHGAASLLLNQSVPVPVVSRYLDHGDPSGNKVGKSGRPTTKKSNQNATHVAATPTTTPNQRMRHTILNSEHTST